ncbi:N-acetylglucosamine-6-phosphate deacetylase [Defluviimonas sp. WL0050]|uniref:N-acetylglucosamine-6-phosphate deacetylase n=1 Tax=Albidovulum litorale TaxID=2984134 RepID=A0ABT2ZI16_9RHOB|nr:N-acetylglucosamine-6-phosphate deacetylase [Defluviimonas sp. WL0050]MCV2870769.1 N-acetylglucosamine-6-phosphate deacetylase [Defluviimonas sp. WL0050]
MNTLFTGADVFDGARSGPGSLLVKDGRIAAMLPPDAKVDGAETVKLDGGVLAPGFVDLQLNGGGGVMFNDAPNVKTLTRIAAAHASLGSLTILPTLITDTPDQTRAAVEAVEAAIAAGVGGIAGLHLEGPHLSIARKGAHDPSLIRPMGEGDLAFLCDAARRLPRLMVTLAPESVTDDQIATLSGVGIIVSLGHTDAGFDRCVSAAKSGARLATHLFNAMSQLGNREPGLVGAVLATGALDAGMIADGIHVHPEVMRAALRAKTGPGEIFLVTDAMAPAGSNISQFSLNGREIRREDGRLMLADGTLAGADLSMARAIRVICNDVGLPRDRALAMATSVPARVLGLIGSCGMLAAGRDADFVHLTGSLELQGVWQKGQPIGVKSG